MKHDEIKKLRLRMGYSQQELAAVLNVSFATVNRWENGKAQPQKDRLNRIQALWQSQQEPHPSHGKTAVIIARLNFEGDAEAVKKAGSISWRFICLNQLPSAVWTSQPPVG